MRPKSIVSSDSLKAYSDLQSSVFRKHTFNKLNRLFLKNQKTYSASQAKRARLVRRVGVFDFLFHFWDSGVDMEITESP